jgi:hypothetical protein
MMSLDLADFRVNTPHQTALHKEQKSHNECALKSYVSAFQNDELPWQQQCTNDRDERIEMTAKQLFENLREFVRRAGLQTNIDSMKSLGWAAKRTATVRTVPGRSVQYIIERNRGACQTAGGCAV